MDIGQVVQSGGRKYRITNRLGGGGQGSVYQIEDLTDKKTYALKIIEEKNPDRKKNKVNNIRYVINEKLDERLDILCKGLGIKYLFPKSYFLEDSTKETGFIMDCAEGKTLKRLLLNGDIGKMTFQEKLELMKKIAKAIHYLHSVGYCYTDISWGNFMWNVKSKTLYVIDTENVSCTHSINDGTCAFLIGTGFFIAPEVAFGKKKAAYNSDRYALAMLFFGIVMNGLIASPYHGRAMYTAIPVCQDMCEVAEYEKEDEIEKNWRVFIFDEKNRANNIDELCVKPKNPSDAAFRKDLDKVSAIWKKLDRILQELFIQTFEDPFAESRRPVPSVWVRKIEEIQKGGQTVQKNPGSPDRPNPAPTPIAAPVGSPNPGKPPKVYRDVGVRSPEKAVNAPQKPYLQCGECFVRIDSTPFTVKGPALGLKTETIGELEPSASGFLFKSGVMSAQILGANDRVKATLRRGEVVELNGGDVIQPSTTTKKIILIV